MPRAALSPVDVERFRESICEVATRLFAEHGYAGVTLRAIATALECSPMTPYRYFRDKAEIFEAVRRAAFTRFADCQSQAVAEQGDPIVALNRLARAYVDFALREPYAYRIMFELDPRAEVDQTEPRGEERRAWQVMRSVVGDAVESGALVGDPDTLAHLLWSGVHGLAALHLAGKLELGRTLDDLLEPFMQLALKGASPLRGTAIHLASSAAAPEFDTDPRRAHEARKETAL